MTIYVDGRTAAMIERGISVLEAKQAGETVQRTRRVPMWLPSGEEVKTLAQASVMMGLPEDVVARYAVEQKDIGEDLAVEATAFLQRKAFFSELEVKAVRHVRDAAYWKMPVGTIIVGGAGGGKTPLKNLKYSESPYDGASAVTDSRGKTFYVTKDPETGHWVASVAARDGSFQWDNLAVDKARTEEEAYRLLDQAVKGDHHLKNKAPKTPTSATADPNRPMDKRSTDRRRKEKLQSLSDRHLKQKHEQYKKYMKDSYRNSTNHENLHAIETEMQRRGMKVRKPIGAPDRSGAAKKAAAGKRASAPQTTRGSTAKRTTAPKSGGLSEGDKRALGSAKITPEEEAAVAKLKPAAKKNSYLRGRRGGLTHEQAMRRAAMSDEEWNKGRVSARNAWKRMAMHSGLSGYRGSGSYREDTPELVSRKKKFIADMRNRGYTDDEIQSITGYSDTAYARYSKETSTASEPLTNYSDREVRDGLRGIRENIQKLKRDRRPVPAALEKMYDEYLAESRKRDL